MGKVKTGWHGNFEKWKKCESSVSRVHLSFKTCINGLANVKRVDFKVWFGYLVSSLSSKWNSKKRKMHLHIGQWTMQNHTEMDLFYTLSAMIFRFYDVFFFLQMNALCVSKRYSFTQRGFSVARHPQRHAADHILEPSGRFFLYWLLKTRSEPNTHFKFKAVAFTHHALFTST